MYKRQVANLPRHGQKSKITEKLQQRVVQMVDTEHRLTSQQILADLQRQGTTVSAHTIYCHLNEKGHYGRRIPSGRMHCGQMRQKDCFLVKDIMALFTEKEMRYSKIRTQSLQSKMVEVERCFGVGLLLLALDALTV